MSLKKDDLNSMVKEGYSKSIAERLVKGDKDEKIEILHQIYRTRNENYLDLVREMMMFEDDPKVRTLCFHLVASMGNRSDVEDLIEVIALETNEEFRSSMLDLFKNYLIKHNIEIMDTPNFSIDTSKQQKDREESKPAEVLQSTSEIEKDPAKQRLLDYIYGMTTDIPISVTRLSEILNIEKSSLQKYLQEFVRNHPDAADYLSFEQVFIKKETAVRKLIDQSQLRGVNCTECEKITTRYPCENCGKGEQCSTCRLIIGATEPTLKCPNCSAKSHAKHIQEWVRIRGTCPNCKTSIKQVDLV